MDEQNDFAEIIFLTFLHHNRLEGEYAVNKGGKFLLQYKHDF